MWSLGLVGVLRYLCFEKFQGHKHVAWTCVIITIYLPNNKSNLNWVFCNFDKSFLILGLCNIGIFFNYFSLKLPIVKL